MRVGGRSPHNETLCSEAPFAIPQMAVASIFKLAGRNGSLDMSWSECSRWAFPLRRKTVNQI